MSDQLHPVQFDSVLIKSTDPEKLVQFYQQGFNLSAGLTRGEDLLSLRLGDMHLGFVRTRQENPASAGQVSLWFRVEAFDETYQRLQDLGATVRTPPIPASGGTLLAILCDPQGNTIGLLKDCLPSDPDSDA